jgi:hypothetical protein
MTPELLFIAAIVVVLAVAFVVLTRRSGAVAPVQSTRDPALDDGVVSDPVPIGTTQPRPNAVQATIDGTGSSGEVPPSWAQQFEPRGSRLEAGARRKLIDDLGMLRAPWCVPLLERAAEEETDAANRVAAKTALERCRTAVSAGGH